jgi:predicted GIY-YIG superfamily endonuclease
VAKITRDAFLVGMKYYGYDLQSRGSTRSDTIVLKREPSNRYDSNAIAVVISGVIAGHLDKKSAEIIAPLLDGGARWRVEPIRPDHAGSASIPLKIVIEQETQSVPAPKLAPAKAVGIYKISIRNFDEIYIGQSRDINQRVKSHWRELNHRIHSNPKMRELWDEIGGDKFDAEIVEEAPKGLTDHDLSFWLQSREEHWIRHHDIRSGVLNFDTPHVILVGAERVEARIRRLAEWKASRETRAQRRAIEDKLSVVRESLSIKNRCLREAEDRIRAASGIVGFFFATSSQKREAKALALEIPNIKENIRRLDDEFKNLYDELGKLPFFQTKGKKRLHGRP